MLTTAIRQEWTCNYPALSETPEQTERRLKLIAMAQSGEFKSVCDTLWPLFVHPARHNDVALKGAVFKMMDDYDTGPETSIRQQKAIMSRPDSRSSLGAIHCPTLVLVGNEDALTPVSAARTIADGIVGAKLDIVQNCGHLSTMERPDAVTAALRTWIALYPRQEHRKTVDHREAKSLLLRNLAPNGKVVGEILPQDFVLTL